MMKDFDFTFTVKYSEEEFIDLNTPLKRRTIRKKLLKIFITLLIISALYLSKYTLIINFQD